MGGDDPALEHYRRSLDVIEAERSLGGLTREQAADAARAAREEYEQACQPRPEVGEE